MINNKMMWRIFDIKYEKNDRNDLPSEIIVDLDKFSNNVTVGFGNLNNKVYKAIENITRCKAVDCKVESVK